jgi:formate-dependent phosphoribosylglycinamide formyltransferase (GAR transformylase)
MRNVVFIAPFPLETTMRFARALAGLDGVRLLGVWQEPPQGDDARIFHDVVRVPDGLDPRHLIDGCEVLRRRHGGFHRILGILEALQVQVAQVRQHFGVPGPDPRTAERFRDKAVMKDVLRSHGLPCARHRLLRSWEDAETFVREVGLPIVLKPPAGAGCKATWRVNNVEELRSALQAVHPSASNPTLAEEFLKGREFSFETITLGGEPRFHSISHYLPGPLEVMETPWIQWVCMLPRDISSTEYDDARRIGVATVKSLGLETGMTHMEWFRRQDGTIAIGEIAARPPGAHIVRLTSLAYDVDMYRAWGRAVVDEAFDGPWYRKYSTGCAFLRGPGRGRVVRVEGIEKAQERVGSVVVEARMPTIGMPKSDSYEGDGYAIVRHPDTEIVQKALKIIVETVQIHYA